MLDVLAAAGMRDIHVVQMLERREIPAFREVVGMVVGGENGIDPHPFQLAEVFGVRAGISAASPLPRTLVVVEEEFKVSDTQVGAAQQLHEFQKVGFSEGA